jgi:hypothetical protein
MLNALTNVRFWGQSGRFFVQPTMSATDPVWRKQFGVLTTQAEEVRALSTKVTAAAAEPIKSQMERAVDGRAH